MASFNIIIPSYGRVSDLRRCLLAIQRQTMTDFEVLCVCRVADEATRICLQEFHATDPRMREVLVEKPGLVAAMNAGFAYVHAAYVTFTDDDSEAPSHWLQTLMDHFSSHPECGAAGGPDRLQVLNKSFSNPPPAKKVGVYSWTGKWHATHHCSILEDHLRVSILKGVNMTYRHELIHKLDIGEGLKGEGSQVGTEPGFAALVKSQGKELHFLRDAWVLHHCAPRQESEDRKNYSTEFALNTTYNYGYTLWRYQPLLLSSIVQLRQIIIGSRHIPGLLRIPFARNSPSVSMNHTKASLSGAWNGFCARFSES